MKSVKSICPPLPRMMVEKVVKGSVLLTGGVLIVSGQVCGYDLGICTVVSYTTSGGIKKY